MSKLTKVKKGPRGFQSDEDKNYEKEVNTRIEELRKALMEQLKAIGLASVLGLAALPSTSQAKVELTNQGQETTNFKTDINEDSTITASAADQFAVLSIKTNNDVANNVVTDDKYLTITGPGTVGFTVALGDVSKTTVAFVDSDKGLALGSTAPKLIFFDNIDNANDVTIEKVSNINGYTGQLVLKTGEKKLIVNDKDLTVAGAALRIVTGKAGSVVVGGSGSTPGFSVKTLILGAAKGEELKIAKYEASGKATPVDIGAEGSGGNLLAVSGGADKSLLALEGGTVYGESSLKIGNATATNNVLNLGGDLTVTEGATLTLAGTDVAGTAVSPITIRASKALGGATAADKSGNLVVSKGATVKLASDVVLKVVGDKKTSGFVLNGEDDAENKTIAKLLADGGARKITIQNESSVPVIQVADGSAGLIGGDQQLTLISADGKDTLIQIGAKATGKIGGIVNLASINKSGATVKVLADGNLTFVDAEKSKLIVSANDILFFAKGSSINFAVPKDDKAGGQLLLQTADSLTVEGDTPVKISNGLTADSLISQKPGNFDTKLTLIELADGKADDLLKKIDLGALKTFISEYNFAKVSDDGKKIGLNGWSILSYSDALEKGGGDDTGISDKFVEEVDGLQGPDAKPSNEQKKLFGMLTANYSDGEGGFDNYDVARALCRSTVEERNRVTISMANAARQAAYTHLVRETRGKELWVAGLGDLVRQKKIEGYGMHAGIWGLTIGYDVDLAEDWNLGALAGYGHASVKYKGLTFGGGNNGNQRSFFGGVYGEWDSLVRDLWVKFSFLAGHSKYKEWGDCPVPGSAEKGYAAEEGRFESSHKGYWLSLNVDGVWLPWEYRAIKIGPWLALYYDYVHQRAGERSVEGGGEDEKDAKEENANAKEGDEGEGAGLGFGKSNRNMLSAVIGGHVESDLSFGRVFAEVGYKRELWRKNKIDDFSYAGLEYAPTIGTASKNLCIVRLGYDFSRDKWGLGIGLEGQFSNNWKDYLGNIVATYSF